MCRPRTLLPGLFLTALVIAAPPAALAQRTGGATAADQSFKKAKALARSGKHAEAVTEWKNTINLDPAREGAHVGLLRSLFMLKKYKAGITAGKFALGHMSGSDAVKCQLGMHLYRAGKKPQGCSYLKGAYASQAREFDVQFSAGRCCIVEKKHDCTVQAFENYLSSRPAKGASKDYIVRIFIAEAYLRQSKLAEAEANVQRALRTKPNNLKARVILAEVLLNKGDNLGAVRIFQVIRAKARGKSFDPHRLNLARAYFNLRRWPSALEEARTYLERNASAPRAQKIAALKIHGDSALKKRRFPLAMKVYKKLAKLTGDGPEIRIRIARVLYAQKNFDDVLTRISGDAAAPNASSAVLSLATRASIMVKDKKKALGYSRRLLKRPGLTDSERYFAAMALSSSGKFQAAVQEYEKVLSRKPTHVGALRELERALCYLARRLYKARKYDQAIQLMNQAMKARPGSIKIHYNLAFIYLALGKNTLALKHINKVLAKSPQDFTPNRLAGRILIKLGKLREALAKLEVAAQAAQVERIGGLQKARVLSEVASVQLKLGISDENVSTGFEEALVQVAGSQQKAPRLVASIRRGLAQAFVLRANDLVRRKEVKKGWARIQKAMKLAKDLPKNERDVVMASAVFVALSAGQVAAAKAIAKKLGRRLVKTFAAPFDKVGRGLLPAVENYLSPAPKAKLKAAAWFNKNARRLPRKKADQLLALSQSASEQAVMKLVKAGKVKQALKILNRAFKGKKRGLSRRMLHNKAVVQYRAGDRNGAVKTFNKVTKAVTMGLCNLGVHHDRTGKFKKSYELFRQCERRGGGGFPGLSAIVKARRRVFQDSEGGGR